MKRREFLLAVSATSVSWACSATSTAPTPVTTIAVTPTVTPRPRLTVRASEYTYELEPDRLLAGLTEVLFENAGKAAHELIFGRVKDTSSLEEYRTRLATPGGRAGTLLDTVGGPSRGDPGDKHEAIFDLAAGTYVAYSGVAVDAVPEVVSKGMWKPLTVARSDQPSMPEPSTRVVTTAKEGGPIALGAPVTAGRQIWKMVNAGASPHSIEVFRLESGKKLPDLLKWVSDRQGARPFTRAGGVIALPAAGRAWAILELRPGDHVLFDGIGVVAGQPAADPLAFTVS